MASEDAQTASKYRLNVIGPLIEKAWDQVWELAKVHPEIIYYRETQVHFEFGHALLRLLENEGLKPWSDVEVLFDTPHLNPRSGYLRWDTMAGDGERKDSVRPDIHILPSADDPLRRDAMRILVELKTFANVSRRVDGEMQPIQKKPIFPVIEKENKRLQDFANGWGWGNCVGLLFALYYQDSRNGANMPEADSVPWNEHFTRNDITIHRYAACLKPQVIPD